jgi:hypothetical protein
VTKCDAQENVLRRSPSYEVEKMEMSGTEGLFELECKKDLLWVMAMYLRSYLEQDEQVEF